MGFDHGSCGIVNIEANRLKSASTSPAPLFTGRTPLKLRRDGPPALLIVIDTEEEFDWSAPFDPASRSVKNIDEIPLAQRLFDRHALVPTYVIDHPVAASADAVNILRPIQLQGRCEIGTHVHPWVNPPSAREDGLNRYSFPGNLPRAVEFQKLETLTNLIAAQFGSRPTIYKAGRYGVGPATDELLAELGYKIDVSVVPYTDFSSGEGPDFSSFDAAPFKTRSGIVALPLTVGFVGALHEVGRSAYAWLDGLSALRAHGIASRLGLLERIRLSPEGHSLDKMRRLTSALIARGERLFMLTCHSSSFLPGGSPYAKDVATRDALLGRIADYLRFFFEECHGEPVKVSAVSSALLKEKAGSNG